MRAVEDDQQGELLVCREAVLGAGGDEDGLSLLERYRAAFDLEHAGALEDDVDLVELMGLLPVGLRSEEHTSELQSQ